MYLPDQFIKFIYSLFPCIHLHQYSISFLQSLLIPVSRFFQVCFVYFLLPDYYLLNLLLGRKNYFLIERALNLHV